VTVQMREGDLLGVDTIDAELFRHRVVTTCPGRRLSLGSFEGIEAFKNAALRLRIDLTSELCHEFAQGAEPTILVPNKLYEFSAVRDQAVLKSGLQLALYVIFLVCVEAVARGGFGGGV